MKKMGIFSVIVGALLLMVSVAGAEMMSEKMDMIGKGSDSGMMPGMCQGRMGQMSSEHMGKKGHHFLLMNADELGLADEQLEKLHKIKSGFEKEYILDRAKLKVAQIELEELLEKDSIDMNMVEKKVNEITGLKGKIMLEGVKNKVEARKILTEEQREKASKLWREKRAECSMMEGMELKGEGESETSKPKHTRKHTKRERRNKDHHK